MNDIINQCRLTLKSSLPGQLDLLRLVLAELNIGQGEIVEETCKGKESLLFYIKKPQKTKEILSRIRALKLKGFRLCVSSLESSAWKTRWKKYARPFNITRRLRVVQLFEPKKKVRESNKNIYIDTTLAFGTGLHATTQLMAKFIAAQKGDFISFLDVGAGTGILSIIASKYGAGSIYAIDLDKKSVATARGNFLINRCLPDYLKAVSFDDFKLKKRFDFVCANLLTEDLIRLKGRLIYHTAPGKYLAVSGIFRDNYKTFRNKFKEKSIKCLEVQERMGWYAVLFKKAEIK